jgi:putative acetyltransferase
MRHPVHKRPASEGKTMTLKVRHVSEADVGAVHDILQAQHVVRGTMRLRYSDLDVARQRIKPVDGTVKLVATFDDAVAGYCELVTHPDLPRHRHAGEINLVATHPDHRGRGVGGALMTEMVELADEWLQLTRLGLTVWTTNAPAIALYERHGFQIEGTMRNYAFCEGGYVDAHVMGRVKGS